MTSFGEREAYMLAGLPGAGKSAAADAGTAAVGGDVLSAGNMIREMARADGLEDPTSDELGEYAKEQRETDGPGFFAEKATGMILRDEIDVEYPIWIDSVRHVNGVREFRDFFDTSTLIYIDAPFETRLERVRERGRDDEEEWGAVDLLERDDRELIHLGTQTILDSGDIDYVIPNDGPISELYDHINRITHPTAEEV